MRRVVAPGFAASGGSAEALFAAAGCVTATPGQREQLDRAMRIARRARARISVTHAVSRTRERRTAPKRSRAASATPSGGDDGPGEPPPSATQRARLRKLADRLSCRAAFDPQTFAADLATAAERLDETELAYLTSWLTPTARDAVGRLAKDQR